MNWIKTPQTAIQETNRNEENTTASPSIIQPTTTIIEEPPIETILYRSLPFVPVLTPNIRRILKKEYPNVKIAAKTVNTTAKIFRNIKDPVEPLQQSNVIYQVPCNGCPMTYIGMTTNCLRKRMYGHQSDINKYNSLVENDVDTPQQMAIVGGHTALIEHMILHKHTFDLKKVKIIDRSYRSATLPILEMCHIANTTNTVNRRTDVDGLSIIYAGILHTVKSQSTSHTNNTNSYNSDNIDNTNTITEQLVEIE